MTDVALWWCRRCGRVRAGNPDPNWPPLCNHGVPDTKESEMEPLPSWHPLAKDAP